MFKVNNKTPERPHGRRSSVVFNFGHTSHLFRILLLLILNK